jgi:hypothetical protein
MSTVHLVECVCDTESAGAVGETVHVAKSRDGAIEWMAVHPNCASRDIRWCFLVYGVEVGSPRMEPLEKAVFGRDMVVHGCIGDAWRACESSYGPQPIAGI